MLSVSHGFIPSSLSVQVVDYYEKVGQSGFLVYEFKLNRLEGQPQLTTDQVNEIQTRNMPSGSSHVSILSTGEVHMRERPSGSHLG